MKKNLFLVIFLFFCVNSFSNETWFLYSPSLSPDGKRIVFVYEGDFWIVPSTGGTAYRLTGMNGNENLPRFSPDGKWIAFTGSQDGNANVYVVPAEGGDIKQLTFHSGADNVDSWSWDSKYIYLTSGQLNSFS
jgi:tricorn protease